MTQSNVINVDIKIDQNAAFFYWVQNSAQWDEIARKESRKHKEYIDTLPKLKKKALSKIAAILTQSTDPRTSLAHLYTGDLEHTDETTEITATGEVFRDDFEMIWEDRSRVLHEWQKTLSEEIGTFKTDLIKIAHFLDSRFNPATEHITVYLIPPEPGGPSVGHVISGTQFILLRPSGRKNNISKETTLSTLLHEYIHLIEFSSRTTRKVSEASYRKIIEPLNVSFSDLSWKMVYAETLAYIFANNITGGYFKPQLYASSLPSADDMRNDYHKLVSEGKYETHHIISWVGLVVLPDVIDYLNTNRTIDHTILNNISALYREFFEEVTLVL